MNTLIGIENIQGATKHTASANPAYKPYSVNGVRNVQGPYTFQTIICVGTHTFRTARMFLTPQPLKLTNPKF